MLTSRALRYALLAALALAAPGVFALSCAPSLTVIQDTGGSGGASSSTSSAGAHDAGHDAHDAGHDAHDGAVDAPPDVEESDAADSGDASDGFDGGCMAFSDSDPHNCGACFRDCCGGQCVNSVCQPFVIAQGNVPGILAVDSNNVYWPDSSNTADGGIMYAPKAGAPGGTPLTIGQDHPAAVAVDANFVYWVTYSNTVPNYGGVFKVPLAGGAVIPLVPTGEQWATDILISGTSVFWDDYATNEIRRSALDGTNVKTVASMSMGVSTPLQMAIDSQFIYWGGRFGAPIQKAPINGSGAMTLANGTDAVSVAVDTLWVYWANYSDGSIQKAPINGGMAVTIATSGGGGPYSIAVAGKYVYWADQGKPAGAGTDGGPEGSIRYAPTSGTGAQGKVLTLSPNPKYLAIDPGDTGCVYWSDTSNGNIGVMAKPP